MSCSCGRDFVHCRFCGSKSVYTLLAESQLESAVNKRNVVVRRCKRCMRKSSSLTPCEAGVLFTGVEEQEQRQTSLQRLMKKYGIQKTDSLEEMMVKFNEKGAKRNEIYFVLTEGFGLDVRAVFANEVGDKSLGAGADQGGAKPQEENANRGVSQESQEGAAKLGLGTSSDLNTEGVQKANTNGVELSDLIEAIKPSEEEET